MSRADKVLKSEDRIKSLRDLRRDTSCVQTYNLETKVSTESNRARYS